MRIEYSNEDWREEMEKRGRRYYWRSVRETIALWVFLTVVPLGILLLALDYLGLVDYFIGAIDTVETPWCPYN